MDEFSGMDLMAEITRAMNQDSYQTGPESEQSSAFQSCESLNNIHEKAPDKEDQNIDDNDNLTERTSNQHNGRMNNLDERVVNQNNGEVDYLDEGIVNQIDESMDNLDGKLKKHMSGFISHLGEEQVSTHPDSENNNTKEMKNEHNEAKENSGSDESKEDSLPSDDPNIIVDDVLGNTALHNACADVDLKLVRTLIEKGASVHRINAKYKTMIHELVIGYCSLTTLDRVYEQNNFIEILTILIKEGVDVNDVDLNNKTALHYMMTVPRSTDRLTEVLKAILMSGARVNIQDRSLQTPLHMAVQRGDTILVEVLIDHGADPNVRDSLGQSPIHLAVKGRRHKAVIGRIAATGVNLNSQNAGMKTPLHIATKAGRLENVEVLLRYGARLDIVDSAGNTCIHLAAAHEPSGKTLQKLLEYAKSNKNLKRRRELDLQDYVYGETALHKAVRLNMVDNLKVLCRFKPDPNIRDVLGETPLHKASHSSDILIWNSLLKLGGDTHATSHSGLTPKAKAAKAKNLVALAIIKQFDTNE